MLHQLTIQSRSPAELHQLAVERRELAALRTGKIRALLLKEAELLEFHAELRNWVELSEPASQRGLDGTKPSIPHELAPFFTKLTSRMALSPSDQQALLAVASPPKYVRKDECLIEQGAASAPLFFLCSGMAHAVRSLSDGKQQIVAVFVAGDTLNAGGLPFRHARTSICALTPVVCLSVPFRQLDQLMMSHPAIARALWLETAAQAAIQQEWMVWQGRRMAQTRLAHFLCEVSYRLELCGGSPREAFEFPLTQRELGDTLALSAVHVNRTLQMLRSRGLIELSRQRLVIRDKAGLYEAAEFDPRYLDGLKPIDSGAA
jgi:CRP-like cAMP-binding protein